MFNCVNRRLGRCIKMNPGSNKLRKKTWKFIGISLIIAALFGTGGYLLGANKPAQPKVLMLLTADSLSTSEGSQGTQYLRIEGVEKTAQWFTDRPEHLAGQSPTDFLLTQFFTYYPENPPNVTISMMVDGVGQTRIVELSDPKWDGDVLEFTSKPLKNDPLGLMPPQATTISITIDDVSGISFINHNPYV